MKPEEIAKKYGIDLEKLEKEQKLSCFQKKRCQLPLFCQLN
jgi:hypothetical protein